MSTSASPRDATAHRRAGPGAARGPRRSPAPPAGRRSPSRPARRFPTRPARTPPSPRTTAVAASTPGETRAGRHSRTRTSGRRPGTAPSRRRSRAMRASG
ncbi:hypothetical protein F8144_01375 [Streptomyces triticiradicis]|uniref:Uncharacterized protein n=1 Tax=Streptomyces triticiradicis TaxID=2651189 RepID=A0A7J5DPC3_9ACTN|nr:hypothetical protein F8144_01375 [Streptomyces triticiradicis]